MKTALTILLVAAGGVAAWIAWRAPSPDHQALALEAASEAPYVPAAIPGPIPAGFAVRTFDVDGPCCSGCTGKLYEALVHVPGVEKAAVAFSPERTVASVLVPVGAAPEPVVAALTFDKYSARAAD